MKGIAFFISPEGKIIKVSDTHIKMVIDNPKKFKLSKEEIEKIYKKFGEKLYQEGNAREEILLDLVRKGWLRVREYQNRYWSIQINQMNKKVKDLLWDFANKGIDGKSPFKSSVWDTEMIRIVSLKDKKKWQFNFGDIAGDILFTEAVPPPYIISVERMLLEVCSIEEYKPRLITFKEFIE